MSSSETHDKPKLKIETWEKRGPVFKWAEHNAVRRALMYISNDDIERTKQEENVIFKSIHDVL